MIQHVECSCHKCAAPASVVRFTKHGTIAASMHSARCRLPLIGMAMTTYHLCNGLYTT